MSAILILLGMFSFTLVIANLGFLKKIHGASYFSIPVVCGFFFSSEGLIPVLPSTLENLSWALRVALTWVAFMAGTRVIETAFDWQQIKKLIPFFAGFLLFFGMVFIMTDFSFGYGMEQESLAMALILSSALFSSKKNPFLLSVLFVSLLLLSGSGMTFTYSDHVYPLTIGLLVGVVCRLVISPKGDLDTATRLALVGFCMLGTGWAVGMGSLEVLVGLAFGWSMAVFHRHGICSDPKLKATEAPLILGIAFFAGLYMNLNSTMIVIGICAAVVRFLLKWLIIRIGIRDVTRLEALTEIVPISQLALPIIVSIHLSPLSGSSTAFLLNCFCVGLVTNDILALIVASWGREKSHSDAERAFS